MSLSPRAGTCPHGPEPSPRTGTAPNSGYRYLARTGDIFRTIDPANEEKTYLVVALGGEDIQLQDQKSRVTVRLGRSEKP